MTEVLFDMYELLVENIFGSVGLAIMGVAFAMILILFWTKTSKIFIIYWMMFYFIVMGTAYIGSIALILGFMLASAYAIIAVIRLWFRPD
ncbi:unnamed protein product [marine sediment metagenome]|uniref:Uncharacterized protein n=1 Tax=marine sediment metagenome TaxID=412755 RepID=X0THA8_9ZZZZ